MLHKRNEKLWNLQCKQVITQRHDMDLARSTSLKIAKLFPAQVALQTEFEKRRFKLRRPRRGRRQRWENVANLIENLQVPGSLVLT